MSLVKWIRKNNRKIMTFVVIFCMVAFVIGSYGLQILSSYLGGGNRVIATYDDGTKLKQDNFMVASNELNVLKGLMADRLLLAQGSQNLAGPLLSRLIFPDSQFAGDIAGQLKQMSQQGQINISLEELDAYFNQPAERAEILWILLRDEAYKAGCITPTEFARGQLKEIVPLMSQGQFDAAALVQRIIGESNITEEQVIRVFADLLSVMDYAGNVINNQTVTTNQVKATLARGNERIDADFVKIPAEGFINEEAPVAESDIKKQFEMYKNFLSGIQTDENPYGFGYKLPKRVQLEYIVVKMDDVKAQTAKVTAEEMESYYSRNIDKYSKEVPSDPANPESEKKKEPRAYTEVENQIRNTLVNEKTQNLANLFFSDIKDVADEDFGDINPDEATVTEMQEAAGDFQAVAQQISAKHQIAATVGQTGLLSPEAFGGDDILGRMMMPYQRGNLPLAELAFTVTEEAQKARRIGLPALREWQTMGPFSGGFYDEEAKEYHRLMALVRVIDIEDEAVAENVDVTYDTKGLVLFDSQKTDDTTFSVRELVKKDVALLKAMNTASERGEELAKLIADHGWDEAIKAYNSKYATDNEQGDAEIKLDSIKQQSRISQVDIESAKRYMQSMPARASYLRDRLVGNLLANKLYTLLPEDKETTGTIQATLAFEPASACYVVKEVVRQPATTKDYEDGKARTALQLGMSASSELSLIHFKTENILKRMNYEYKMSVSEETDETESQDAENKDEAA